MAIRQTEASLMLEALTKSSVTATGSMLALTDGRQRPSCFSTVCQAVGGRIAAGTPGCHSTRATSITCHATTTKPRC